VDNIVNIVIGNYIKKLCGPDLKRKLNDNPLLYRRSIPKTISFTTTQNVSSPPPTTNNDNEKSEISHDKPTMIKTESS